MKQHRLFNDQNNSIETADMDGNVVRLDFILSQYERETPARLVRILTLENAKRLRNYLDKAVKLLEEGK